MLAEQGRPASVAGAARLVAALEARANVLVQLTRVKGFDDQYGHTVRAVELAAAAGRSKACPGCAGGWLPVPGGSR